MSLIKFRSNEEQQYIEGKAHEEKVYKEIERLRKALKTYGIHNEGCSIYANCHNKCTCGFEKTLKEGE